MGSSSTKESRPPHARSSSFRNQVPSSTGGQSTLSPHGSGDRPPGPQHQPSSSERPRGSRHEHSFFGLVPGSRDAEAQESRRETKQEREARRAEREKQERMKERERSIKEEGVDGGYLVTLGTYTGPEDFNKVVVRQLMVLR